jgi:Tol biopolymer transport system component
VWSAQSRDEEPLTAPSNQQMYVYDWSSDGKQLLVAQEEDRTHEVWLRSAAPMPNSEPARKIIFNPAYHLYQPHFSLDGRWIVFEAIRSQSTGNESTLYVTPATGGPWIRITDGEHWDDKPRWAPDGKTLYFVSSRGGFLKCLGNSLRSSQGKGSGGPLPRYIF